MARRATQRTARVGQEVRELLASLLLFDVADPRLKEVQILAVEVATDLKVADVFYIMVDPDDPEPSDDVRDALERSAGYLRKMLGERMSIKFVPELRFRYDQSIERGRRMEALLNDIRSTSGDDSEE